MMFTFFDENPDCAEKFALHGIDRMRQEGLSDDDIRDHFDHLPRHRLSEELDIDDLLAR